MSQEVSKSDFARGWKPERVETFDELWRKIREQANSLQFGVSAWRGHGRAEWQLETTLDRELKKNAADESYRQWLDREQTALDGFGREAEKYASPTERNYLNQCWNRLAFGRHAGLPTRLLDWTMSPWVAAWFACHEHADADGALWWFDQQKLGDVIHPLWPALGVKTWEEWLNVGSLPDPLAQRFRLHERVLESTAFKIDGKPWITQLHYGFPCPRMEAQQAFMTVCGRLGKTHDAAIDELDGSEKIGRGRIVIPARLKEEVLNRLQEMNIHAKSLEYPGVDIVARRISI